MKKLFLLLTGIIFFSLNAFSDFSIPFQSVDTIKYQASWGSGEVLCATKEYGRIYTCTIVKPCAPKGENPCGCEKVICQ